MAIVWTMTVECRRRAWRNRAMSAASVMARLEVIQFVDRTGAQTMRAAAFAFTPTWIAVGMLAIAAVAAIGLVATSGSSSAPELLG